VRGRSGGTPLVSFAVFSSLTTALWAGRRAVGVPGQGREPADFGMARSDLRESLTHFVSRCVVIVSKLRRMAYRIVPHPRFATTALCCAMASSALAVGSEEASKRSYDLPAGAAAETLNRFAGVSGEQIIFMKDRVEGEMTNAVLGRFSAVEALGVMLAGTRLSAVRDPKTGVFVIVRAPVAGNANGDSTPNTQPPKNTVKNNSLWARMSAGLALLSVAPQLSAQAADSTETQRAVNLPKFEVVSDRDKGFFAKNTMAGTRSNQRLVNIPQNIQIVNNELILDLAQDNPIEALKYGSSGVNKRTSLLGDMFIRGFRVRGFLKDGVPFGGNFNVPLYDVDRLEIVKGPAALLYGQASATGGLMNIVTKRPTAKRQSSVRATVGSFDFRRVEATSSGPLGVGGANYRATVAMTDSDGARRFEYFEDRFFGFAVDKKLTAATTLSFDYSYYQKDQILSQINANTNGELTKLPADFSLFENWVDGPNFAHYGGLSLKSQLTPTFIANLELKMTSMDTDWNRINANGLTNASTGMMNRTYQNVFQGEKVVTGVVDFVKTFSAGGFQHAFSFGGITTGSHGFGVVDAVFMPPLNTAAPSYGAAFPTFSRSIATPGQPAPSSTDTRARQDSGYVQHQVSAFDSRLIVVGGLRYNEFHNSTTNKINRVISVLDDNKLVKRWGIVAKPIDPISVYYNYSESFIFNTGTFVGGPRNGQPLEPSLGKNREFGAKVETSDGRFFGSVAVFDMALTKVRVLFPLPDGTGGIDQRGTETNKGFEADLGTYLQTPIGPFQAILTYYSGDQRDSAGLRPNGVTNDTWSAYISQSLSQGALSGLKFGFGVYRKGDVPFASVAGQARQFIAPAYQTSTALIAYEAKRYRVALNFDNVFDKFYIEGGENATWLYTNPGRTVKFSVDYRF
jgi:iron complex outermembrane receptor protein